MITKKRTKNTENETQEKAFLTQKKGNTEAFKSSSPMQKHSSSNMIAFFQVIFCYKILKCNKFIFYKAGISLISLLILTGVFTISVIILLSSVVSGIKKGSRQLQRSRVRGVSVPRHNQSN